MINIIKYELFKKKRGYLLTFALSCVMELYILFKNPYGSLSYLGYLMFLAVILILAQLMGTITSYSKDLNGKTGYMLYMLPYSGFKITLAKVLTAIIEGLSIWILLSMFLGINILLKGSLGPQGTANLMQNFRVLPIVYFLGWFLYFISAIFTSMTLVRTIFIKVRFGGLITFITFVTMTSFLGKLTYIPNTITTTITSIYKGLIFYFLFLLLTLITGWLIDKKMDF